MSCSRHAHSYTAKSVLSKNRTGRDEDLHVTLEACKDNVISDLVKQPRFTRDVVSADVDGEPAQHATEAEYGMELRVPWRAAGRHAMQRTQCGAKPLVAIVGHHDGAEDEPVVAGDRQQRRVKLLQLSMLQSRKRACRLVTVVHSKLGAAKLADELLLLFAQRWQVRVAVVNDNRAYRRARCAAPALHADHGRHVLQLPDEERARAGRCGCERLKLILHV